MTPTTRTTNSTSRRSCAERGVAPVPTVIQEAPLGLDASGWFTGRDLEAPERPFAAGGNLSHHRPHRPADLASDRAHVARRTGTDPSTWHLMQQVHGAEVATVRSSTPIGAQLRGVDALVTTEPDRPLLVQIADCVPILLAADGAVGAVHAGRRGVVRGVVDAALAALERLGVTADQVRAAIGPAIGGCCYELPHEERDRSLDALPDEVATAATATTDWGSPSLDLAAAAAAQLTAAGATVVGRVDACTRCDPDARWFSHRADPDAGRQVGLVLRRADP